MASRKPSWLTQGNLTHKKATIDASSYKCQKCLQLGHFTYQCSNKRKHASRITRTQILEKKMEEKLIEKSQLPETELQPPAKKSKVHTIPKADELSDLSSGSSQESDSESTDSDSSSGTSSSNESVEITNSKNKIKKNHD